MRQPRILLLALALGASFPVWPQAATPPATGNDPVVLRVGDYALTKSEYEKLVIGFDRASGAVTSGADAQSMQSGKDVARLLALVSEAQRRKIDQEPKIQALMKVRGLARPTSGRAAGAWEASKKSS